MGLEKLRDFGRIRATLCCGAKNGVKIIKYFQRCLSDRYRCRRFYKGPRKYKESHRWFLMSTLSVVVVRRQEKVHGEIMENPQTPARPGSPQPSDEFTPQQLAQYYLRLDSMFHVPFSFIHPKVGIPRLEAMNKICASSDAILGNLMVLLTGRPVYTYHGTWYRRNARKALDRREQQKLSRSLFCAGFRSEARVDMRRTHYCTKGSQIFLLSSTLSSADRRGISPVHP